jgi:hypothetical protein
MPEETENVNETDETQDESIAEPAVDLSEEQ